MVGVGRVLNFSLISSYSNIVLNNRAVFDGMVTFRVGQDLSLKTHDLRLKTQDSTRFKTQNSRRKIQDSRLKTQDPELRLFSVLSLRYGRAGTEIN